MSERMVRQAPSSLARVLKPGFVILTALIVFAAVYTSILILKRQQALREVSRYNATWLVAQAALEVSRLTGALESFERPGSNVDLDEVELRLDIVSNRVKILTEGGESQFIQSRADLSQTVAELAAAVAMAEPMLEKAPAPGAPAQIHAAFYPLLAKLNRLAASVHERGAELVMNDLHSLERLSWTFSGLLIGLIFCSFGLIGFTRWNYGRLEAAHHEVGSLFEDLHVNNARFDAALNNMSQGLCMGRADMSLVVANDRFHQLFGLISQVGAGTRIEDLYQQIGHSGKVVPLFARQLMTKHIALIENGLSARILHEAAGRSLTLTHEPMSDGGWVTTYEDTTEQRVAEARIIFMANHDILTGLPNRLLFRTRLMEAIAKVTPPEGRLAVICVDLDRFKEVNDSLGHPAGDCLLRIVAARLRNCTSENDVVARLGGDEFVVFCSAKDGTLPSAAIAGRIIQALSAPYDLDGHRTMITASAGIAETIDPLADPDLLLKNADIALYKAKASGKATFRFFEAAMEIELVQRRLVEMDLSSALENGEFEVHYQPVLGLQTQKLVGFEALMRWRHPVRGLISPADFIPIAEETGQIVEIGAWILRQACAEAVKWPEPKKIAVNLSAVQFGTDLVATVAAALQESGLPPHLLELEITETVMVKDNARVLTMMRELKSLGVRTVLDDFGTGYSALSYLRVFPFDKLKIDQAFVRDICEREESRAIVASIVQLAMALGMTTTAEGIETVLQVDALIATGCDEVQGYFFGRPEPADRLHRWFGPKAPPVAALLHELQH